MCRNSIDDASSFLVLFDITMFFHHELFGSEAKQYAEEDLALGLFPSSNMTTWIIAVHIDPPCVQHHYSNDMVRQFRQQCRRRLLTS